MEQLSVGIIGFGRIGAEHAQWLAQCTNAHAVATADATPARLDQARQMGLIGFAAIDDLLKDNSIGAILISTPTAMHFAHASAALNVGKHVMIEKPMAMNFAESKALVDLAKLRGRMLSVFHNRRWDLDYLTVASAIQSGALGKIIDIESRLGQWASCVGPAAKEYRPGWRNEASFGGGGLFDWGSHFIDQLWRLMLPAKPVRVFAQLRGNIWTKDCDDFARVCIDFDNGAVGMVEINTTTTRPLPRWHVDGTEGSADSPFSLEFDLSKWAELDFTPAKGGLSRRLPLAGKGLSETEIWDQFAKATSGQGEPAVTAESVLPTMQLLDAARESSKSGQAIEVARASRP